MKASASHILNFIEIDWVELNKNEGACILDIYTIADVHCMLNLTVIARVYMFAILGLRLKSFGTTYLKYYDCQA